MPNTKIRANSLKRFNWYPLSSMVARAKSTLISEKTAATSPFNTPSLNTDTKKITIKKVYRTYEIRTL